VKRFAAQCGVTRLADITGLDRIGIPTYSAVVPKSEDILSVYNGKGALREDAKAGALMEAIERQVALNARPATVSGSYREVSAATAAIDPESVYQQLNAGYGRDRTMEWVEGWDLVSGSSVLVPAKLAGYLWHHLRHPGPFRYSNSHGLASGNCLEEAVAHALCEWIERDAWTMAELKSHWRPWARTEAAGGPDAARSGWDDLESYPCLDLSGIGEPVAGLWRRFRNAGLPVLVRDITSDLGIPTVLAAGAEDNVPGFPQAHFGLGTHPDIRTAVSRALSELAQSRCVDIQGVREDIAAPDDTSVIAIHTRRVACIDRRSWINAPSAAMRSWKDVPTCWNGDILDDIRWMLERIRCAGAGHAVLVDLSLPEEGIYVVRVIVPGLESWAVDHGRIGWRATKFWRSLAA
jgi:ribosomal protein S12 methylthiotransferase accessory factor